MRLPQPLPGGSDGDGGKLTRAATILAILTALGLLPVLVIAAPLITVSTATLAVAWLLIRRYR